MAGERLPVTLATRVLHVAESGHYAWKNRAPSARSLRHTQLTEAISGIHTASRGTYGFRRVHAELALGLGIHVSHGTVELLMRRAGLKGPPVHGDRVRRDFTAPAPNRLWLADIERHEALLNRVGVKDHHRPAVAAAGRS